jgi:hypothetical protein
MTPPFDLVVHGATGFTGRLVVEYLLRRYPAGSGLRWAMGGRNADKLAAVRDELGAPADTPLVVTDTGNPASLQALMDQTRLVLTTVGPYQLYGNELVAACASAGVDYVDLCGEPAWMRQMIDAHEAAAKASGARIVFSCGFDSIPFDLGVFMLQREMQARFGHPADRVRGRVRKMKGTFSGGTAASLKATMAAAAARPGVLELLDRAAAAGAQHVGGLDPALIDRDPVGQLDGLFRIAAEYGCGLDIHLHEPGDLGAFAIDLILDRVERDGIAPGKVNVAHGFAVVDVDPARRRDLLDRMGALGVTMTTVAPVRMRQLPLAEMDASGVRFGFGTDGIRDLWSPYGDGDLLGIAWQYARAGGVVRDEDLLRVVEIATRDGAAFVTDERHDLAPGARADVVLLDAENPMDALVRRVPRAAVVAGGRVVDLAALAVRPWE